MLISSTLPNRANAGFEPTPERITTIITQCILDLNPIRLKDDESFTILEPCIGRSDLGAPVATLPQTKIVGIEQDPARCAHPRTLSAGNHPDRRSMAYAGTRHIVPRCCCWKSKSERSLFVRSRARARQLPAAMDRQ
jgi:hypothetical protein